MAKWQSTLYLCPKYLKSILLKNSSVDFNDMLELSNEISHIYFYKFLDRSIPALTKKSMLKIFIGSGPGIRSDLVLSQHSTSYCTLSPWPAILTSRPTTQPMNCAARELREVRLHQTRPNRVGHFY